MTTFTEVLGWLKGAGESTRLRLLALCAERDYSVSDLARVLKQSEPRVSRHLKVLCDAGLLVRVRQGQWVHYRIERAQGSGAFIDTLLTHLDRRAEPLAADRERAHVALNRDDAVAAPAESRLGRALRAFMEANLREGPRAAQSVVFGVDQLELLECAAAHAERCAAVARSRRAAQTARAYAERRGFACRVLAARAAVIEELPRSDALVLNHVAAPERPLVEALALAARSLEPHGSLTLFERYEALEAAREAGRSRIVEHPLARLRRLLAEHGFDCLRLTPIEADGEHVLAAAAVPAAHAVRRTG